MLVCKTLINILNVYIFNDIYNDNIVIFYNTLFDIIILLYVNINCIYN